MSNVHQIKDQAAKTLIYNLQQDMKKLIQRIEELEGNKPQMQPIGYLAKGGGQLLETAFKKPIRNIGD